MSERLLSADDVADRIGWNTVTVYRKAKIGEIPGAVRFGKCVRFRESQIDAWLKGTLKESKAAQPPRAILEWPEGLSAIPKIYALGSTDEETEAIFKAAGKFVRRG